MVNLISSSLRHTEPGDPVELAIERRRRYAVAQVVDGGSGPSPERV